MPPTTSQTPAQADQNPPEQPATGTETENPEQAELERLRAENADLRRQLAEAGRAVKPAVPNEPKFTFSEGQRAELEMTGRSVSPFTGKRYVGTGVDDAREATVEEFTKATPPERPKAKVKPTGRGRRA